MGWSYRKSIKLGPFRLNLSRGGVVADDGTHERRCRFTLRGDENPGPTAPVRPNR
jgi:hypothetical protein